VWNSDEFQDRVAVVTGGSEGIGYAICQSLCEAGSQVHFCTHDAASGEAAQASLGPRAHFFHSDLTVPEQILAFAGHVQQTAGKVDFLVNNAANDDRIAFVDVSAPECDRMWALNLRAYLLVARAFLDMLRAGGGKSIVNLGTTNYMFGLEPFTIYNATKSGIVGFTRSLARELGHDGIRANMISPGWIMTEKQLRKYVTEGDKEMLLREQSLKFLLEPHCIAPPVMFLLSSAAGAITGQNLVVDGGRYMQ
jgi:NAD(P)-dependent dehydrogenase (short-subunit alcohol dehydrogenase family)